MATERERITRLETQMETLSEKLDEACDTIDRLTAALNRSQGAFWMAMLLGSASTVVVGALWQAFTFFKAGK